MSKKIIAEIDKSLREVRINLDLYDEKWKELRDFNQAQQGVKERYWEEGRKEQMRGKKHAAVRTATLELMDFKHVCDTKAKIENEMEAVLRKLHRYRQQIIEWVGNLDLRNKEDELIDMRKQIELRYKRGKSFYKLGTSSDQTENVFAQRDEETQGWISDYIDRLGSQAESFEAEIEVRLKSAFEREERGTVVSKGRQGRTESSLSIGSISLPSNMTPRERDCIDQLEAFVELHRMHIKMLESILRQQRNRTITIAESVLEELRESLMPYVENNQDLTIVVADDIYADLGIDANASVADDDESSPQSGMATPLSSSHQASRRATAQRMSAEEDFTEVAESSTSKTSVSSIALGVQPTTLLNTSTTSLGRKKGVKSSSISSAVLPSSSRPTEEEQSSPLCASKSSRGVDAHPTTTLEAVSGGKKKPTPSTAPSSSIPSKTPAEGIPQRVLPPREAATPAWSDASVRLAGETTAAPLTKPLQPPTSDFAPRGRPPLRAAGPSEPSAAVAASSTTLPSEAIMKHSSSTSSLLTPHTTASLPSTSATTTTPISLASRQSAYGKPMANPPSVSLPQRTHTTSGAPGDSTSLPAASNRTVLTKPVKQSIVESEDQQTAVASVTRTKAASPSTASHPVISKDTAIATWHGTEPNQLSVEAGQLLSIVHCHESGWTYGFSWINGVKKAGWFPDHLRQSPKLRAQKSTPQKEERVAAAESPPEGLMSSKMRGLGETPKEEEVRKRDVFSSALPRIPPPTSVLVDHGGEESKVPEDQDGRALFSWDKLRRGNISVIHIIPNQVEIRELKWTWAGELASAVGTKLLHFHKGEEVELLVENTHGWVFGRIRNEPERSGWFPSYMLTPPEELLDLFLDEFLTPAAAFDEENNTNVPQSRRTIPSMSLAEGMDPTSSVLNGTAARLAIPRRM